MKNAFTNPQPPGEEDLVRTPRCIDRNVLTGCETEPNSQFPFLAVELESEALVDAVTVYLDHSWPPCIDFGCYQKIKVTKNHLWMDVSPWCYNCFGLDGIDLPAGISIAHRCTIFLCYLDWEIQMINTESKYQ